LADAGYGNDTDFRDGITEIGLAYAVGIQSSTSPWPPGVQLCPQNHGADAVAHRPSSAATARISRSRPGNWRSSFSRRPGGGGPGAKAPTPGLPRVLPRCGFARPIAIINVRRRATEEWCLIEWPPDEPEPTKYFLSPLPANISRRALVNTTKLRWRIERDYQDLKQELGLGHYEGRGWRGFYHHATLCIAAYGFLVSEREAIPPSGPRHTLLVEEPRVPGGYRPRGSSDPA
jgi:SRSO17 transposase